MAPTGRRRRLRRAGGPTTSSMAPTGRRRKVTSRVLGKEQIADAGVNLLREAGFYVDLGVDWSDEELARRIGDYDCIVIRSATQLDAELIARADRLKVIARAGNGVDNVDVDAATKRGIVVA